MSLKENFQNYVLWTPYEAGGGVSRHEKAATYIEKEVQAARMLIAEGPPIYLWPDQRYPAQKWENPGFQAGWRLINDISARTPTKMHHFYLIDEWNNRPSDFEKSHVNPMLAYIAVRSPAFHSSPLFQESSESRKVTQYNESDFVEKNDLNRCSNLDASFQREKLLYFVGDPRSRRRNPRTCRFEDFNQLRLLVVHPIDFQQQQALMLSTLLGEMKNPPFKEFSKQQRRDLISSIYRHVWVREDGEIDSVTIPIWDGNKFIFSTQVF